MVDLQGLLSAVRKNMPDNLKPGLDDLLMHFLHTFTAMVALEEIISTDPMNEAVVNTKMSHLESLLMSSGPIMAEVEQPLEAISSITVMLNGSIIAACSSFMLSYNPFLDPEGAAANAEGVLRYQDKMSGLALQAFSSLADVHLKAIEYTPKSDEDGDTDDDG